MFMEGALCGLYQSVPVCNRTFFIIRNSLGLTKFLAFVDQLLNMYTVESLDVIGTLA